LLKHIFIAVSMIDY